MNATAFYPLFLESSSVTIDSRTVQQGSVFFAFSGDNFNAAEKAQEAIANGAIAVIVESQEFSDPKQHIYFVPSTLQFLQDLARHHRAQLSIPVIGLTGSNGKTTTKELMHAVLSRKFNVQYTKGNFNNHIGVPLTLLSIRQQHEMAVVEMGANHQGEIAFLSGLAKPTIGYITNFGKAHLEGFGGYEGVIKGKSEIYDFLKENLQTLLINNDDSLQQEKAGEYADSISFGTAAGNYIFEPVSQPPYVGLNYNNETAVSQLTGKYNFTNMAAAAALGLYFGIAFPEIKAALEKYTPTNMRSQLLKKNNATWVLDTYNANPSSMREALQNFSQFKGSKTVIIGDMLELGTEAETEHQQILELAQELSFESVFTVGKHFGNSRGATKHFDTVTELGNYLKDHPLTAENILVKGSRGIALEKILDLV